MKRFFYNPYNNKIIWCINSHSEYYINHKKDLLKFDEYIRGIIFDNILYIRIYYPFDDINNMAYDEILKRSKKLININIKEIKDLLKEYNIQYIKINVNNEDLKNILKLNYV